MVQYFIYRSPVVLSIYRLSLLPPYGTAKFAIASLGNASRDSASRP